MNTYGKSTGHSGNYSTNYQLSGRELLTPDEVRLLDNRYALLFIRGEYPIIDLKYDLLKHPKVNESADGKAKPYYHNELTLEHSSITILEKDLKDIKDSEVIATTYELLSDEDLDDEFKEENEE